MVRDLMSISDETYERWAEQLGMVSSPDSPTEENMVRLVSNTMREMDTKQRAKGYIDIANMALALADKTLGSQVPVAKCLTLDVH